MADDNTNELDGIKISELDQAGTVDNDNDYLVISQQGDGVYTSDYKSYKIHPNQLASQGVTYTAGDFIDIDANNVISATYQDATESDSGLMSANDKAKLNGIESGANAYTLPVATDAILGGVKQGTNVSIGADGTLSATDTTYSAGTNVQISAQNVISATDTTYTAGTNVQISAENVISATDTVYTLSPATSSTLGGVKIGSGVNVAADGTISVSGGGGGSSTLSGLTDVDISSPEPDQVLKYDNVNSKWINGTGGGGSSTLDGLTDVTITTPTNGQVLQYNGSGWINANGGGGGSAKQTAVTQAEYNALVQAGTVDPTMEYFITDGIPYSVAPWTDITATLTAGQTSLVFSNAVITIDSTIEVFVNDAFYGVNPTAITLATGSLTLVFSEQDSDMPVKVRIS